MESWMVMWDFNSYLSPTDKLGGIIALKNQDTMDFGDCASQLELLDMQSVGCYFTWSNGTVCSKLDRALVNNHWLLSNVNAYAELLAPGCISDHSCCIVSLNNCEAHKTKSFKFLNMLALHDKFLHLVRNIWTCEVEWN